LAKNGSKVAVIGDHGEVLLYGDFLKYEGLVEVTLVDGKQVPRGCRVYARWHSGTRYRQPLNIGFRVIGQMRYFNPKDWRPTLAHDFEYPEAGERVDFEAVGRGGMRAVALGYVGATPDLPRGTPEAELVSDYLEWINDDIKFWTQHRLEPETMYTDLFDRTYWRLYEAKVGADRKRLREAVGQLLDYKRFFVRKPSLGVLLDARPAPRDLRFLTESGVIAVWRTPAGAFGDSSGGSWTKRRRS
jgi:hypothetical protein